MWQRLFYEPLSAKGILSSGGFVHWITSQRLKPLEKLARTQDMTKHLLLLGVVGVAFYIGMWVALNGDNDPTPFTRTGPFGKLNFSN